MITNQYPTISFLAMQDLQNRKDLFVIRANGDSMSPKINDGDRVAIRKVEDLDCIYYGQNYLVVTKNYKMIKQIRRYTPDEDNYVILHSANPNFRFHRRGLGKMEREHKRFRRILRFYLCWVSQPNRRW